MSRHLIALSLALTSALLASSVFAETFKQPPPSSVVGRQSSVVSPQSYTEIASYDIQARLDPLSHQIHGSARVTYHNASPDVLTELWLKLYLNAFRSKDTIWMREAALAQGAGFDPRQPGWIQLERLALARSGEDILPAESPSAETVLRVPLTQALPPGGTIDLDAAWTSQLPRVFARTGFAGDFVMAGQWYPKLAVYDRGGWDTEPWHANAEFFADFGTYNLALTVPRGYLTGASGVRQDETDNGDGTITVRYHAERVSDVAWTAWPGYRVTTRAVEAAGQPIELELLTPSNLNDSDDRYFSAAQAALDLFGRWFGAYPWPRLTLVVPPEEASGADGMEYPTLVTLGRPTALPFGMTERLRDVEVVTFHEIAHQWVPLQVATNEAREPWLDEGFADYATLRGLAAVFGEGSSMADLGLLRLSYRSVHRLQYTLGATRQPLALAAWEYPDIVAYGATVYSKGALALQNLERTLGEERFSRGLRLYFDRWSWQHPTTRDLQAALEEGTGESLDWFFGPIVFGRGVVEYRLVEADQSRAVVERHGDVSVPLEIRLAYAGGRLELEHWDGAGQRLELQANGGPFSTVELDPERRLSLEINTLDNGHDLESSASQGRAAARMLALLQATLQTLGLIG